MQNHINISCLRDLDLWWTWFKLSTKPCNFRGLDEILIVIFCIEASKVAWFCDEFGSSSSQMEGVLPRSHFVMNFDGFGSHPSQIHAIYQGLSLGSILWWVWIKSITNPCYILGLGLGSMLWWTASYHWFLMNLSQIVLSLNFSVHAFAGISFSGSCLLGTIMFMFFLVSGSINRG